MPSRVADPQPAWKLFWSLMLLVGPLHHVYCTHSIGCWSTPDSGWQSRSLADAVCIGEASPGQHGPNMMAQWSAAVVGMTKGWMRSLHAAVSLHLVACRWRILSWWRHDRDHEQHQPAVAGGREEGGGGQTASSHTLGWVPVRVCCALVGPSAFWPFHTFSLSPLM